MRKTTTLFVFCVIATFSLRSLQWAYHFLWINEIVSGIDNPYSAARILALGLNPFQEFINEGWSGDMFIPVQAPLYLHPIYFLLAPLAKLKFALYKHVFAFISYISLFIAISILCRSLRLTRMSSCVLYSMAFSFPPFGHAIINGQQVILLLSFFVTGIALTNSRPSSHIGPIVFGLSYIKYTFMPAFMSLYLSRFGLKRGLITLSSLVISLAAFASLHGFSTLNVFGPIIISKGAWTFGMHEFNMYNITSLFNLILSLLGFGFHSQLGVQQNPHISWTEMQALTNAAGPSAVYFRTVPVIISSAVLILLPWLKTLRRLDLWKLISILIIAQLTLMPHLAYDYVYMLVPFAYCLSKLNVSFSYKQAAFLFGWYWISPYFYKILGNLLGVGMATLVVILIGIIVNILILFRILAGHGSDVLLDTSP